ncbi:ATP-binding protein [Luteolibacter sp. SL250]|uniref:ATP-binding protein n=1 Tax=Luteolibacter sp. SL250 TaxID=2995170 RepID=UPI00226F91FE|nr:ATP-binding protein [Luteolibacter sp. SL250]WAC20621.1 ATP-binding protein [Luteolibacter sp. SL250]
MDSITKIHQPYNREQKALELEQAFSPSSPILEKQFFAGRISEIDEVVDSINERGQHVIVYGERGVGKTSFSNIIGKELIGVFPVKVTCNRSDSFKNIWGKAFAKVKFEKNSVGVGYLPVNTVEELQLDLFLPESENVSPLDIQLILEKVEFNLLFIFDEYDSIIDPDILRKMADTIKALSDNAPKITVMIVGIADNVAGLIGAHPSIERCMRQVLMPRMSDSELDLIISRGLDFLGFGVQPEVRARVVKLSQGFPHFTHLLTKQAAKATIEDGAFTIGSEQYARALVASVARVDESIRLVYQQATFSTKDKSNFEAVLWACANSASDEHGTFSTKDVVSSFEILTKKSAKSESLSYHVGKLCLKERGCVLHRVEAGKYVRFRFVNPLFRAYVKMKYESVVNVRKLRF